MMADWSGGTQRKKEQGRESKREKKRDSGAMRRPLPKCIFQTGKNLTPSNKQMKELCGDAGSRRNLNFFVKKKRAIEV